MKKNIYLTGKTRKILFFGFILSLFVFQNASAQNVGITNSGSIAPNYLLHLYNTSDGPLFQLTNASTGSLTTDGFIADITGTKVSLKNQEATGTMALFTNGSECITILNTGQVGISKTNPAYSLDVVGDVNYTGALRIGGAAGSTGQILLSQNGSANTWLANGSSGQFLISQGAANPQWQNGSTALDTTAWLVTKNTGLVDNTSNFLGTTDNIPIRFVTQNSQRAIIDGSGYMGINTASSSSYQLYVTNASTTADNATIYGAATGNARTYGVYGSTTAITTNASGVFGYASGASGSTNGVWGYNVSTDDYSSGVYGQATQPNANGVYAFNTAAALAGNGCGLWAQSAQSGGAAGWGVNTNAGGDGFYAINSAASGNGVGSGIQGLTSQGGDGAVQTAGVWAILSHNTPLSGCALGGFLGAGSASGFNNVAVSGIVGSTVTAAAAGVYGACFNTATPGRGVAGYIGASPASSFAATGVSGVSLGIASGDGVDGGSNVSDGFGVGGWNSNASGTGVVGAGNNISAYSIVGGGGGAFSSTNVGLFGYGNNTAASWGVYGKTDNSTGRGVYALNNAAAGSGIGWGLAALSNQSGGSAIAGSLYTGASLSYFSNAAVSGIVNSTLAGGFGVIGACDNTTGTGVRGQTASTGAGSFGVFGYRSGCGTGTGYSLSLIRGAVVGYTYYGYPYAFGVAGYRYNDYQNRSGGVLGHADYTGTQVTWGSLGYRSSGAVYYGAYYTSAIAGAGKILQGSDVHSGIGMGGYGDLMGGWIKGNIYGLNVSGSRYSLYIDGKTYTNNVIAQLTENSNTSSERIVTYVPTSTTVDIYAKGKASLVSGKATIVFPDNFKELASDKEPVIVTITPIGQSKGIYLDNSTKNGFTVIENDNGKSNIEFTWIAIGTRKGYENPENPTELLANDYDSNMYGVMFNENNTSEDATPIWWDGKTLRFDELPVISSENSSKDNSYEVSYYNLNEKSNAKTMISFSKTLDLSTTIKVSKGKSQMESLLKSKVIVK